MLSAYGILTKAIYAHLEISLHANHLKHRER